MMRPNAAIRASGHWRASAGLTLVELMVAMALGLLVVLAAVASLLVSRQGFTAVDAASQLRDNGRFLQSIVQRLGTQAGYKDCWVVTQPAGAASQAVTQGITSSVYGLNNAARAASDAWSAGTGTSAINGSDILVLRYQANPKNPQCEFQSASSASASSASDGSMIDCSGFASPSAGVTLLSILHVGNGVDGEPTLMCSRSSTGEPPYDTQPLISGVENFQVLYGVDGIGPGGSPASAASDTVPERYLRADQLTAPGNDSASNARWRHVRSIRIGVVLRGAPHSGIEKSSQILYPLGISADATANGGDGSAFASADDRGSKFNLADVPDRDRDRLRQVMTFTVHLRNAQDGS